MILSAALQPLASSSSVAKELLSLLIEADVYLYFKGKQA